MAATDSKFSNFADGGDLEVNDIVVGLRNGVNTRFNNTGTPGLYLPLSGGEMDGPIDMDNNSITGLPTPTQPTDAVNKAYADGITPTGAALTRVDDANVTLTLGGTPGTALLQAVSITAGWSSQLSPARGGTGVNNGSSTITIGGSFTMSGAFTFNGTLTGNTSVTFPTSGTLATTAQLPTGAALTRVDDTNVTLTLGGTPATALLQAASITAGWSGQLSLTRGGTNASLTASNGGIIYSTATAMAVLSGTATAGQMLRSGASGAPSWSTATYPATAGTTGNVLTSDGTNWVSSAPAASVDKISQGRLTLTTNVPVTTVNVTAATTLYFTPFKGNQIDLYTGSVWERFTFSQFSIAVPSTTVTMYDVWVYNNSGTPALELLAWTNISTRATALTTQDGVYVKSGDATRRYVGSIYTTGVSGQTEDSSSNRFVWNYYNRVCRPTSCSDNTNSWTYSSSTIRQANGSNANQVNYVIGVAEDTVHGFLLVSAQGNSTSTSPVAGIGINSTTVNSAQTTFAAQQVNATGTGTLQASYNGIPSVGANYMAWLESNRTNANTVTWFGDNNDPTVIRSGLSMEMWG